MTTFVHTSDWHIGGSSALKEEALPRQLQVLDAIADTALARGIEVVVMAGDVFDVDTPTEVEQMALLERVLAYDRAGLRLLCIRGNHDHGSMGDGGRTAIRYLAHMSDHGVFRGSVFAERTQYVRHGDTVFVLLCHRPRYFHEDSLAALTALRSSSLVVDCRHVVMVCHEGIRGSITDTNYRMASGADVPVMSTGETVPDYDVTYWAIGDIHQKQRVAPRAWYCGAPLQIHFGDAHPKGVLVVDTDNPDAPEFVPIESKRLVRVHIQDAENVVIPENAHVKTVGTLKSFNEARERGLITDAVVKFEVVKEDVIIEYQKSLGLRERVTTGVQQLLEGEDLELGLRELSAVFSAAGVS